MPARPVIGTTSCAAGTLNEHGLQHLRASGGGASAAESVPCYATCPLRDVLDWLAERGNLCRHDTLDYSVGTAIEGAARLDIVTARAAALRAQFQADDERVWPENYAEREDDEVTRVTFNVYGDFDYTLISQCAAWLGAVVHDHQSSEVLAAEDASELMLRYNGAVSARRSGGT